MYIVGKLSPWINLDSDVPDVRNNSEKVCNKGSTVLFYFFKINFVVYI